MSDSTETKPGFTIRAVTSAEDVPHVLELIEALAIYEKALSSCHATVEKLTHTLGLDPANPGPAYAKALLLFPDDSPTKPAALALYTHNYSTWLAAPGIWLEDLFVQPAYRGRGYGTALIAALAREVRRIGGGRLEWCVLKWNEPSIRFYEGPSVGATALHEWQTMRVHGEQLDKLAARGGEIAM